VESFDEILLFSLFEFIDEDKILSSLKFPEGISITKLTTIKPNTKTRLKGAIWRFDSKDPIFTKRDIDLNTNLTYKDSKGRERSYNLTNFVENLKITSESVVSFDLLFKETGVPNPLKCVKALFNLKEDSLITATKLKTLIKALKNQT
jgi:hypothetical protein